MNKKYLSACVAVMVAVVGLLGAVAAQAETKVAVFDAQDVINNTNAAKRAVSALTSKRNAAQSKIDALEKPLIEKQKKIKEQQAVMSPDAFQKAQADFAKDLSAFRTQAQAIQVDLDSENLKLRKQVADAVRAAVEAIAKEKGYDLVLPKGMTFYTGANVPDISAEALSRANKALDK